MKELHISRRAFLGRLLLFGGPPAAAVYARGIEPRLHRLSRVPVRLPRLAPGAAPLRVLHLSDMHASDVVPLSLIARAFALGLRERPDLILVTGDFITREIRDRDGYLRLLRRLSDAAPCFACPGNHDGGRWAHWAGGYDRLDEISALLRDAGIRLLHNESTSLTVAGRAVELVGAGDDWAGDVEAARAFAGLGPCGPPLRLLLSHNPDAKRYFGAYAWDLMLCGHTHGGQLILPLIGRPFAPVRDLAYVEGLHPWQGRLIYTTRGIGNLHGLRFNCRPEVSLLEIGGTKL